MNDSLGCARRGAAGRPGRRPYAGPAEYRAAGRSSGSADRCSAAGADSGAF